MRIEVTGRRLEITDAINAYAENKCQKLLKFFDGIQEIEVVLDTERREHHEEFSAELIVDVVKHDPLVSKAEAPDVYAALDLASDKMARQLKDFKEKLKETKR